MTSRFLGLETCFVWLCGGTGLHSRLKICRPMGLWVRIPPELPKYKNKGKYMLCFSCDKRKQKYITGLCELCHRVAMATTNQNDLTARHGNRKLRKRRMKKMSFAIESNVSSVQDLKNRLILKELESLKGLALLEVLEKKYPNVKRAVPIPGSSLAAVWVSSGVSNQNGKLHIFIKKGSPFVIMRSYCDTVKYRVGTVWYEEKVYSPPQNIRAQDIARIMLVYSKANAKGFNEILNAPDEDFNDPRVDIGR